MNDDYEWTDERIEALQNLAGARAGRGLDVKVINPADEHPLRRRLRKALEWLEFRSPPGKRGATREYTNRTGETPTETYQTGMKRAQKLDAHGWHLDAIELRRAIEYLKDWYIIDDDTPAKTGKVDRP